MTEAQCTQFYYVFMKCAEILANDIQKKKINIRLSLKDIQDYKNSLFILWLTLRVSVSQLVD